MPPLRLADGDVRLDVLPEAGGRIVRLRAHGHDLLRTPDDPAALRREPYLWGSYPMVPWCNRVPGGRLRFDGRVHQLPAPFEGHAIHGRGVLAPWTVVGETRLELRDPGDDAFPWPYLAWQEFALSDGVVRLTLGMENTGRAPMPAGLGIHPWFRAGAEVRLPAGLVYPARDSRPLPGPPIPVTGRHDLRAAAVPPWGLDDLWTGLTERRIALRWPDLDLALDYRFTADCDHVVLATVEPLGAVAIEPQTHATDGHRRLADGEAGAIGVLDAGDRLEVAYELAVS